MSACFSCSLIRSSPLIQDPYLSWPHAKLVRPISSLRLRKYSNASPRIVVRATEQGLGVVSPDDMSLLQDPPLIDVDTIEKVNEEVHGVIDGVADTKSEDKALTPSTRVKKKKEVEDSSESRFKLRNGREDPPLIDVDTIEKVNEEVHGVIDGVADTKSEDKALTPSTRLKKKKEVEDSSESRFKLRNGREIFEEKVYAVGVEHKRSNTEDLFGVEESLKELTQLADTAGLMVVGSTYQKLVSPNSRTYIGSGKVAEIKSAINALGVETVIFDDELSAGQLRNLEKAFGGEVRVCDRTALILDIFNQRAATHEAALQVALAQMEYQLPRLTKMWTHLERQAGGKVKGMGEKQIEVDKRILRTQIGVLKKELESVRKHRKQYRNQRLSVPVPVVSLVGYTNAGKSTLLNQLTGANVLAEDRLFATLDPTTRRVQSKNGKEFLLTDTVGFIQKLPTTVVAAFRATLEEIAESSLLVHVVDISHPLAEQQIDAVDKVLSELDVSSIPRLIVWNKVDKVINPESVKLEAEKRDDVVCISALSGEGVNEFCNAVQEKLKDSMVWVEALIPFEKGELLSTIHKVGMVERTVHTDKGTLIKAHVPLRYARLLTPLRQLCIS